MILSEYPAELLSAPRGRGNSVTCFAARAAEIWEEDIPKAGTFARDQRRKMIEILAKYSGLSPCELVSIVRQHKKAIRADLPWPPPCFEE